MDDDRVIDLLRILMETVRKIDLQRKLIMMETDKKMKTIQMWMEMVFSMRTIEILMEMDSKILKTLKWMVIWCSTPKIQISMQIDSLMSQTQLLMVLSLLLSLVVKRYYDLRLVVESYLILMVMGF
jgi:hypothetical protein